MAIPSKSSRTNSDPLPMGFDVTCLVGHVTIGTTGEDTAYAAAMRIIGIHGADGEYSFPSEDGGMVNVTVYTAPPEAPGAVD